MDWSVPQTLEPRLSALRSLVAAEVVPLEGELFRAGFPAVEPRLLELRGRARELGLFAPHLPRDWGGAGLTLPELALVGEALGWSPLGHYVCNCQAPDAGNMELLLRHGSDEQRRRWLAPLARGEVRSCFGMTEPGRPGSNPTWLATTARRDGGDYVIDGHKWFTSGAEGAAFCIVMAITDAEAGPHARASMLLVPADTPGFELVRNLPVMGEAGAGWASHGEVRLTGVRVPAGHRIGGEGAGFALAQERLGPGRIHHCMRWIGICERAFDLMCRHAVGRELAPGDALASRQLIQAWVVDASPLAYWWRHERGARIYDGPDEVHKTAVARRILAAYASPAGGADRHP